MRNKQAIFVTMIVICGIALIFVGIGRERLRVERGTCANRECISQIQGAEEAAEDLPKGAQNIDYFVWVHELLVEMEFQLSEEQFVQWAGTLGWDRNEVVPNKGDGSIILSGLGTEKGGHLVEIDQSYSLRSMRLNGSPYREILYDVRNSRVYLQIRGKKPDRVVNEVVSRRKGNVD